MDSFNPNLFELLVEKLPFGIIILELISREEMDFKYVYANENVKDKFNVDPLDFVGENTRNLFAPAYEGSAVFPRALIQALDSKKAVQIELETYVDDRLGPTVFKGTCVYLKENHVALVTKASADDESLTQKLSIQRQMLEHGEQAGGLCTWIVNEATGETQYTKAYLDLHHFVEEEINTGNATEKCIARIHHEDQERMEIFRKTPYEQYPVSENYRYESEPGKYIWLKDTLSQYLPDGNLIGTTQDVTLEKENELKIIRMNESLAATNEELRASNEELADYAEILRQVQKSLEQSEALFRNLADHSPIGITLSTVNRKLLYVNAGFGKMIGYEAHELSDIDWKEITYPEDQEKNMREYNDLIVGRKEVVQFDKRYFSKHGEVIWASLVVSKMWDKTREEDLIITSIQNITDRKNAEEESRKALNFQEKIMLTSPEIIYVYDLIERRNVFANKSLIEELGYSQEEVIALGADFFPRTIHPADLEKVFYHHSQVLPNLTNNQTVKLEYRMRNNSTGEFLWLASTESVFERDQDGKVVKIIGIARNITKEKEDEIELKKLNLRIKKALHFQEKVLETTPEVIFIYDLEEKKNIFSSRSVMEVAGYTQEEISQMGNKILDQIIHPDDLEQVRNNYANVLNMLKPGEKQSSMRRIVRKDGGIVWQKIIQSVFDWNDTGKPKSIIGITMDISNEKLAEDQREAANKELEQFVYSVSHDLRAPVRHIEAYTALIEKEESDNLSEEGSDRLGKVIYSARRLGGMIDDLLVYSRNRNITPVKAEIDSKALIANIVQEFSQYHIGPDLHWEIQELPNCFADKQMITQVWENLVSNAIKYSSKKAACIIKIKAEDKHNEVVFSIHDNGAGFNSKYANKLFTPFQRLHKRSDFPGHGIGLANVARMLHHHGGKIWAEGKIGEGASFYFTIPKQKEPISQA